MAWRFKVSKYKNAAPLLPKKEDWVSDIKVGAPQSCGNHIKASAAFIAFNVENRGGGSLGLVPLDYKGRVDSSTPLIHGHSDLITDFNFSPFDDGLLATSSTDANVRVWHIPEAGLTESLSDPEYSLPQFDKRVENVLFHPTTEFLLTVAYFDTVKLWDIKHEKEVYSFSGHEDQVQNTSWDGTGSLFVSTSRDRTIRIVDPRADKVAYEAESHKSPKDSRVQWLGQTDRILSTGWDSSRVREVRLRDLRNFSKPYKIQGFDSSTGILMPLYDPDTNMVFLAGKADVSIMYWEVTDKDPFLTEGLKHNGSVQTKGACLVPKRGLDVMAGEVNRLLQLTSNAIIPITYQVPRKTYREFHADIFPDTPGYEPSTSISQWLAGTSTPVKTISLDPTKRPAAKFQIHRGPLSSQEENRSLDVGLPVPAPRSRISNGTDAKPMGEVRPTLSKPMVAVKPCLMPGKPCQMPKPAVRSSFPLQENKNLTNEDDLTTDSPLKNHLAQLRKTFEIQKEARDHSRQEEENTSKLASIRKAFESRSVSMDDKMVERRREEIRPEKTIQEEEKENVGNIFCLCPSGRVCKFRHLKGTPGHKNTCIENLRDLSRTTPGECDGLAGEFGVGGGKLGVRGVTPQWAGGKLSALKHNKAGNRTGAIHRHEHGQCSADKVTILKWHPLSKGVLAAAGGDLTIKIWDILCQTVGITLTGHPDQIFSMAWSPRGRYLATMCRDATASSRHRGFSKVSERQISVYKATELTKPANTVGTDISPAMLIPFYDSDCSTLFATGKGDSTIYAYEIGADFPHIFPLSHHKCTSVHQGLVMLPKIMCDVRQVEFCKALRLTSSVLEPLSFTVPRVKTELFQDDIFPPTFVSWEPVMTAAEWLGDTNRPPQTLSLQPSDMLTLSESREQQSPVSQPNSGGHIRHETPPFLKGMVPTEVRQTQHKNLNIPDEVLETQIRLEESMSQQMSQVSKTLEQDRMEGVDSTEWED
ncbi:coronin-7-like [Homarus americanus]|uniref:coronin-7-like n=1 Tax=Homarus americanus TaxID=6706 RepID=UPI001C4469BE|nr:coronin-7-like [Homarus americanus]